MIGKLVITKVLLQNFRLSFQLITDCPRFCVQVTEYWNEEALKHSECICIRSVMLPTINRVAHYLTTHHLSYKWDVHSFFPIDQDLQSLTPKPNQCRTVAPVHLSDQIYIQRWTSVFRAYLYDAVNLPLLRSPNLRFDPPSTLHRYIIGWREWTDTIMGM